MRKTALVLLDFQSPYHVGWRTAEPVIEGFTIHRSLIYVWVATTGNTSKIIDLINLRVSAALPAVPSGNCYKILLPIPQLPSRIPLKKKKLRWITTKAAVTIARETPYIVSIEKNRVLGYLNREQFELCYKNEVIYDCTERIEVPLKVLERVDIHINRMDRTTNAADVYKVTAFNPHTKLGVVVQGGGDTVDYARELFKLLGELGIGGMRSRGFGEFVAELGAFCDEQLVLDQRGPGWLVLLGSYVFSDSISSSSSIVNKRNIAGYAGPSYDSYILPYLDYVGSGSIVYATKTLNPVSLNVKTSHVGALLVFNPVAAGVKT